MKNKKYLIYSLLAVSILVSCTNNEALKIKERSAITQNISNLKLIDIQKNGLEQIKYPKENPLVQNLFGFNSIWALNDSQW